MEHIGGNSIVIKEININLVRKALKEKGPATKQQIAELTGLSQVTVGTVLQQLIKASEALETEQVPSRGGRPAQQFQFNDDFAHALILFPYETRGTIKIRSSIVNLAGNSLLEEDEKTERIDLDTLERIAASLVSANKSVKVIGLGLPGVEADDGSMIFSDYKDLLGVQVAKQLNKCCQLPVKIENDVNAAVAGFVKRKKLFAESTVVYLYFPDQYAPGAGIYINGQLYKGKENFAGEVASIPLGITWGKALYQTFDELCEAVSKLIIIISSVLNPHHIVLNGSSLGHLHIKVINQLCSSRLPKNMTPNIMLSDNFITDYQQGLAAKTLELLEPDIALTRKF